MTTAKHTPGPWYATTMGEAGWVDVFAHGVDIPIASTRHQDQEANARLIAAAPDLLAALQEIAECAPYWSEYDVPLGLPDRIRAAVARATGGAA